MIHQRKFCTSVISRKGYIAYRFNSLTVNRILMDRKSQVGLKQKQALNTWKQGTQVKINRKSSHWKIGFWKNYIPTFLYILNIAILPHPNMWPKFW